MPRFRTQAADRGQDGLLASPRVGGYNQAGFFVGVAPDRARSPRIGRFRMSLRIPKERKQVVLFTRNHKVEGEMYLLADSRISDELNVRARDFVQVINARVYTLTGDNLLYTADFVTVNKHSIDLLLSKEQEPLDL